MHATAPRRPYPQPQDIDLGSLGVDVGLVIPAYNEARNLPWLLDRLPRGLSEVYLVDGDSADDTVAVARRHRPDIRVLGQHAPGKGAALAAGLLASSADVTVMIDADGSMDPLEIPVLVTAVLAGADVVKGSRYLAGGGSSDLSPLRSAGNRGLGLLARTLTRQPWSELCYGLAAFRHDALAQLGLEKIAGGGAMRSDDIDQLLSGAVGVEPEPWAPPVVGTSRRPREYGHGFEIETLLFMRAALLGLTVAEVPSFEYERRHGESNLSTFRDGLRVLGAVRHEVRRSREARSGTWQRTTATPVGAPLDAYPSAPAHAPAAAQGGYAYADVPARP